MAKTSDRPKKPPDDTPVTEWIVVALGAVLVVGAVGYMTWFGLTRQDGPPRLVVTATSIEAAPEGFTVAFTAHNAGAATAATVLVSGELWDGGRMVAVSRTMLDYVPEKSDRRGGLFFTLDPRQYRLVLRAEGYSEP